MNEINKLKTESILSSLSKPNLSESELVNSQKRVWNELNTKLTTNPTTESQTSIVETSVNPTGFSWSNLLLNISRNKAVIPLLVLVIIFSVGGLYIYNLKTPSTQVHYIDDNLKSQLSAKIAALPAFNSQDMSSSYMNTLKTFDKPVSQELNSTGSGNSSRSQTDSYDGAIVYTVKHIGYDFDSSVKTLTSDSITASFDPNKFYTEFELDSSEYQKSYIKNSSNKILAEQVNTPEYMLIYQGGKYAAKINYEKVPENLNSLAHSTFPERDVLQNIVNNNAEDLGIQEFNNISYHVFQVKMDYSKIEIPSDIKYKETVSTTEASYSMNKYFLNTADLSLFRQEAYDINGHMTSAEEYYSEKLSMTDAIAKYINYSELSVPVKEFTDTQSKFSSELPKLTSIFEKYNLVYYDDGSAINSFNDFAGASEAPLYKIYSDRDFDPNFLEANINSLPKYLLSYSQNSISYEIYPTATDYNQTDSATSVSSKVIVNIGNEKIEAKKSLVSYSAETSDLKISPSETMGSGTKGSNSPDEFPTNYGSTTLEFTYKGKYYVITDYNQINFDKLNFKVVDKSKAEEFDKVNVKGVSTTDSR